MTRARPLANVLAAVVLVVILCALVAVIIDEKCSRHESDARPVRWVQDIPLEGGKK